MVEAREVYFEVSSSTLFTPTQRIVWHLANLQRPLLTWTATAATAVTASSTTAAPVPPVTPSTTASSKASNNKDGTNVIMTDMSCGNGVALRLLGGAGVDVYHQSSPTHHNTAAALSSTHSSSQQIIGWATQVKFVFRRYRILFALDASPSLANMDVDTGRVHFGSIFECLANTLRSVVQPMTLPGTDCTIIPEIEISVLAQDASSQPVSMLMQGTAVTHTSVEAVLGQLESLIAELQHSVARSMGRRIREAKRQTQLAASARAAAAVAAANGHSRSGTMTTPISRQRSGIGHVPVSTKKSSNSSNGGNDRWAPDSATVDLRSLLQNGLFALERMASEAAPILILLTDGVLSIPAANQGGHTELLSHFIQRDVTCSVIHLAAGKLQPQAAFGYLPDADMLRFLCRQTGGVFVEYDTIRTPAVPLSSLKETKTSQLSSIPLPMTPITPTASMASSSFAATTPVHADGGRSPHPILTTTPLSIGAPSPLSSPSSVSSTPSLPPLSIMMALQSSLLVRYSSLSRRPVTSSLVLPPPPTSIPPSLQRRESSQQLPQLTRRRDGTLIGGNRLNIPSSSFFSSPFAILPGSDGSMMDALGFNDGPSSSASSMPMNKAREKVKQYRLAVDILRLLECRVKDGFKDGRVTVDGRGNNKRLIITLVMDWQPDITVEYVVAIPFAPVIAPVGIEAMAPTPFVTTSGDRSSSRAVHAPEVEVEIHIIGSVDFLTRLWWYKQWLREAKQNADNNEPAPSESSTTATMAGGKDGSVGSARLWASLTDIENTDVVLYHLSMIRIPTDALLPGGRAAAISTRRAPDYRTYNEDGSEEKEYLIWPAHLGGSIEAAGSPRIKQSSLPAAEPVYLSSDWYLWRKMASTQNSTVWRRWFHVDSFDVICSLHHQHQETHEVDDELEVDPLIDIDVNDGHGAAPTFSDGLFHASTDLRGLPQTVTPLGSDSPRSSSGTSQPMILLTLSNALAAWSSIPLSKQLFIRFLEPDNHMTSASSAAQSSTPSSPTSPFYDLLPSSLTTSSPFCAVRLTWTSAFLVSVQLAFFAVSPVSRAAVLAEVKALIASLQLPDLTYQPSRTNNIADPSPSPPPTVPEEGESPNDDDEQGNQESKQHDEKMISPPSSTKHHRPLSVSAHARSRSDDDIASMRNGITPSSRPLLFQPDLPPLFSPTTPNSGSGLHPSSMVTQPMHVRPFGFLHKPVNGMLLRTSLWPTTIMTTPGMPRGQLDESRKASLRLLRSYMRHHQWTWRVAHPHTLETSLSLLRRARAAEGFALVALNSKSSTWLRELPLSQPHTLPTSAGGQPLACVVQYSITRIGNEYIQTELWMEPFSGTYSPAASATSPSSPSSMDDHYDTSMHHDKRVTALTLFNWLCSWLHSCDLHLLAAVSTFDTIRQIELRLPTSDGLLPAPPLALSKEPSMIGTHAATNTAHLPPSHHRLPSSIGAMLPRGQTYDELSSLRPPQHPPVKHVVPTTAAGLASAAALAPPVAASGSGLARTHTSDELSTLRHASSAATKDNNNNGSNDITLLLPQLPQGLYSDFHCDARFDYGGDSKERSFARSVAFNTTRFASSRADSSLGSAVGWTANSSMPSLKDAYLPFPSPAAPHRSSFRHEALMTDSQHSKHVSMIGMNELLDNSSPLLGSSPMLPTDAPPFLSLGSIGSPADNKSTQASLLMGSSLGSSGSQAPLLVPTDNKVVRPTVSITTPSGGKESKDHKESKGTLSRVASVKRLAALQAAERERNEQKENLRRNIEVPLSITYLLECASSSPVCFATPYVSEPPPRPLLGLSASSGPILESPRTPSTPLPPTVSSLVLSGAPLTGAAIGVEVLPPLLRSVSDPQADSKGSLTATATPTATGAAPLSSTGLPPLPPSTTTDASAAKSRRRRMLGADDEQQLFEAERAKKEREDKAKREALAVKSPGQRSSERMHDMLVHAIRRLADVELVEGRCFGHIISEYVIAFVVLPRRPGAVASPDKLKRSISNPPSQSPNSGSHTSSGGSSTNTNTNSNVSQNRYGHSEDIHDHLDQLLFQHHARPNSTRMHQATPSMMGGVMNGAPQSLPLPVCSDMRGIRSSPHICALVFECLRDDICHPRARLTEGGVVNDAWSLSDGRRSASMAAAAAAAGAGLTVAEVTGMDASSTADEPSRSQLIITDLLSRPPLMWSTTPAATMAELAAAAEAKRRFELKDNENDNDAVMIRDVSEDDERLQVASEQTNKLYASHNPPSNDGYSSSSPSPSPSIRQNTKASCTTPFGDRSTNQDIEPLTHVHGTPDGMTVHALTHEFHARILKAHTRNFVRGLYLNLVEQVPLSIDDLHRAIHSCVEYSDVVDVSYIQTSIRGAVEPANSDRLRFASRFVSIISRHFRPIEGTSYFYYAPPTSAGDRKEHKEFKTPLTNHDIDDPEVVGFMRSFPIPFFLRLEAVLQVKNFTDDGRSHVETINLPVTNSTSLVDIWHAGVTQTSSYNGSGSGNGTAIPSRTTSSTSPAFPSARTYSASGRTLSSADAHDRVNTRKLSSMSPALGPNASNTPPIGPDGTAARDVSPGLPPMNLGTVQRRKIKVWLRLACITLRPYHESTNSNDSKDQKQTPQQHDVTFSPKLQPKPARHLANLPVALRNPMADLRTQVTALVAEEAVRRLQRFALIKADHIRWFKSQLPLLPSSSLTRFAVPLHFVDAEKDKARALFPEMFMKAKEPLFKCVKMDEGVVYHVQRIPDASPAPPVLSPTPATVMSPSSPPIATANQQQIVAPSITAAREWREGIDDNGIPFWLTIVFRSDFAHICFHTSLVSVDEQNRVKAMVERAIVDTVRLVNQQCLLSSLNATRVCSSLMIPMTDEDQAAIDPATAAPPHQHHSTHGAKHPFNAGHFACPRREALTLSVHERVSPAVALSNLVTLALLPFAVTNRHHVYVYQEKSGAVFYMRLSDKKPPADKPIAPVASTSPAESKGGDSRSSTSSTSSSIGLSSEPKASPVAASPAVSPTVELKIPSSSPSGTPTAANEGACLYLDIYGVEYPTDEITSDFHKMLQNKLATVTLSLLSQLLHRNMLFRLTPADHRFIRPMGSAPAKALVYPLTWSLAVPAAGHAQRSTLTSTLMGMAAANGGNKDEPITPHSDDIDLNLDVLDPFLFLLYLKQNVQQYLPGLNLAATDRKELNSEIEKQNEETRRAATAALPIDSRMRAEVRTSDFFFIYNNYSAPSTSSIKKEIGKGMATVYCSLIDADGFGPISALETAVRQPWNAHRQHNHIHVHKLRHQRALDSSLPSHPSGVAIAPTAASGPFGGAASSLPHGLAPYQSPVSGSGMDRKYGGSAPVFDPTPPGVPATPRLGPMGSPTTHASSSPVPSKPSSAGSIGSPSAVIPNLLSRLPTFEIETIAGGVSSLGESDPAADRSELTRKGFNLYDHLARSKHTPAGLARPLPRDTSTDGTSSVSDERKKRFAGTGSGRGGWCLVIEIWSLGSVNNDALAERLTSSINQTFHEYLIETLLHTRRYEQALSAVAAAAAHAADALSGTPSPNASYGNVRQALSSGGPSSANLAALSSIPSTNSLSSVGSVVSLPSIGSTGSLSSLDGAPLTEFAKQGLVPCLDLLASALAIDTQSVQRLHTPLPLARWSMDTLLTQLQSIITGLNPALQPLPLASSKPSSSRFSMGHQRRSLTVKTNHDDDDDTVPYVVYHPNTHGEKKEDKSRSTSRTNYTLVAGFGATLHEPFDVKDSRLRAMAEEKLKRAAGAPVDTKDAKDTKSSRNDDEAARRRAPSIGSRTKVRKPKEDEHDTAEGDEAELKGFSTGSRMLHGHLKYIADGPLTTPAMALAAGTSISVGAQRSAASGLVSVPLAVAAQHAANVQLLYRNCALIITITDRQLTIWTYNWRRNLVDQLSDHIYRLLSWNMFRQHLLAGVLHQKMGLFMHCSASSPTVPVLQRTAADDNDEVPIVGGSGLGASGSTATPSQPNAPLTRAPSMSPSGPVGPGLPHNRFARGGGMRGGLPPSVTGRGGMSTTGRGMATGRVGLDMSAPQQRSPRGVRPFSSSSTPASITPTSRDASSLPSLSLDGDAETKDTPAAIDTTSESTVAVKGQFTVDNIEILIDNPAPPSSAPSSILASLGSPLLRPIGAASSSSSRGASATPTSSSSGSNSTALTSSAANVAAAVASASARGRPPSSATGHGGAPPGRSGPVDFSALRARRAAKGGDASAAATATSSSSSAAAALATSPPGKSSSTVPSSSPAASQLPTSPHHIQPVASNIPAAPSYILTHLSPSLKQRPFGKLIRGLYAAWNWTRHAQLHRATRGHHRRWSHHHHHHGSSSGLSDEDRLSDPVQRHASHLKLIIADEEHTIARRVHEQEMYSKWQALVSRTTPMIGRSSQTVIPEVIKAARVVQVSRAPLLFNDLTKSLFVERMTPSRREFASLPLPGRATGDGDAVPCDVSVRESDDAALYLTFLEGFIHDYVKYLESMLHLKVVATDHSEAPPIKVALAAATVPPLHVQSASPLASPTETKQPINANAKIETKGAATTDALPSRSGSRPQDVPTPVTSVPRSVSAVIASSGSPVTLATGSGDLRSSSPAKTRGDHHTGAGSPTVPIIGPRLPLSSPVRLPTAGTGATQPAPVSSTAVTSQLVSMKPVKVFMHKIVKGFTMLVQLRFQDVFACCNLSLAGVPRLGPTGAGGDGTAYDLIRDADLANTYMQHVIELANTLHLNSFTYDFHLRHFLTYITDHHVKYPHFSFVDTLSAFSRFYPEPPGFARNHLIHRHLDIPLLATVDDTQHFFAYLSRHAARYKLGNMDHRNTPPCVFLISVKDHHHHGSNSGNSSSHGHSEGLSSIHTSVFGPEPFPVAPIAATGQMQPGRASVSSLISPPAAAGGTSSASSSTRGSGISSVGSPASASSPTASSLVYLFLAVLSPPNTSTVNVNNPSSLEAAVAALSPNHINDRQETKGSESLSIQYFVLRVDKHNVFPYAAGHSTHVSVGTAGSLSSEGGERRLRTEAEEWTHLANKLVGDVAASAETYLRRVVQKALIHYQRDELWRRLVQDRPGSGVADPPQQVLSETSPHGAWISLIDYEVFRNLTFRRTLHVADYSLADLAMLGTGTLKAAIWRGLWQHLLRVYHPRCRQFILRHHHHLIIINKHNSDLALHCVVSLTPEATARPSVTSPLSASSTSSTSSSSNTTNSSSTSMNGPVASNDVSRLKIFACRRELVSGQPMRIQVEENHIAHLVNTICHFLWQSMLPY